MSWKRSANLLRQSLKILRLNSVVLIVLKPINSGSNTYFLRFLQLFLPIPDVCGSVQNLFVKIVAFVCPQLYSIYSTFHQLYWQVDWFVIDAGSGRLTLPSFGHSFSRCLVLSEKQKKAYGAKFGLGNFISTPTWRPRLLVQLLPRSRSAAINTLAPKKIAVMKMFNNVRIEIDCIYYTYHLDGPRPQWGAHPPPSAHTPLLGQGQQIPGSESSNSIAVTCAKIFIRWCKESTKASLKRTNEDDIAQAARTTVRTKNFMESWVTEATKVCWYWVFR